MGIDDLVVYFTQNVEDLFIIKYMKMAVKYEIVLQLSLTNDDVTIALHIELLVARLRELLAIVPIGLSGLS